MSDDSAVFVLHSRSTGGERERFTHLNEVCVCLMCHEHVWVLGFGLVCVRSTGPSESDVGISMRCVLLYHEHAWALGSGLVHVRSTGAERTRLLHFNEVCVFVIFNELG